MEIKMLRKLILGAVAAVAIGLSAGAASAAPPIAIQPSTGGFVPQPYPPYRVDFDYVVFVKHGHHWHRYGRYETRWQAERAVRSLEYQGYFARIEVVRDRW
jgi:hypothetical protein